MQKDSKCVHFLLCLHFSIIHSLYSDVILKPKQVICLEYIFLCEDSRFAGDLLPLFKKVFTACFLENSTTETTLTSRIYGRFRINFPWCFFSLSHGLQLLRTELICLCDRLRNLSIGVSLKKYRLTRCERFPQRCNCRKRVKRF